MAGKNKLLRHCRFYYGGVDLSGDAMTFGSLLNGYTPLDFTGWTETMRYSLADQVRMVGIAGFQAFLNDATGGAFTELSVPSKAPASMLFGSEAAPTYADPAYTLYTGQEGANVSFDSKRGVIVGDFYQDTANLGAANNPWGIVLYPKTTISVTTTGTSVDTGKTHIGYTSALHVFSTSSGNYEFKVQHSTNGAWAGEEATLFIFSLSGSTISSEIATSASTSINQYIRLVATKTAGTVSIAVTFAAHSG